MLIAAVFLASSVEMVEALTIVLAVGTSRGWRSALEGAGAAVIVLGAVVAAVGPAIVTYVPIGTLRLVIGFLLLVFGLQWLRKAILRSSGWKAHHDEDAIYQATATKLARDGESRSTRDSTGFMVAFKGVFLEGTEVVIIVLTLGAANHRVLLASAAALAAAVSVAAIGAIVARQLSSVPENAMKMVVGLMLVSFGSFWSGEGLGVHWPASDASILLLVAVYGLASFVLVRIMGAQRKRAYFGDLGAQ